MLVYVDGGSRHWCYLLHVWHGNVAGQALRIAGRPPLVFVLVQNAQDFALLERQIISVLSVCVGWQIFDFSQLYQHKQNAALTLALKSNFPITRSSLRASGRRNGVVSR